MEGDDVFIAGHPLQGKVRIIVQLVNALRLQLKSFDVAAVSLEEARNGVNGGKVSRIVARLLFV